MIQSLNGLISVCLTKQIGFDEQLYFLRRRHLPQILYGFSDSLT